MVLKPASAKILDFETSFDAMPVPSGEGLVVWADVRIDYTLSDLRPSVTIRVPVPWIEADTSDQRKAKALRLARELIDHACKAAGAPPAESVSEIADAIEEVVPPDLEGITQELGLAAPTARPRKKR